eukprot:CAMPEP_0179373698 /NCGR_PEP_ID=MMETSP0797-20121207/86929_1 /TAXON_ID=47934 /ORGANISM="Dinophysis acuminata, Strain DAEP01" /LENGTH=39 /DNA_ID= /DNA_START= /DNA_END= /DNA_ORIENTATION=
MRLDRGLASKAFDCSQTQRLGKLEPQSFSIYAVAPPKLS